MVPATCTALGFGVGYLSVLTIKYAAGKPVSAFELIRLF